MTTGRINQVTILARTEGLRRCLDTLWTDRASCSEEQEAG